MPVCSDCMLVNRDIRSPVSETEDLHVLRLAMRFSRILAVVGSAVAALALPALPTTKVVPDNDYIDPNLLISQLACSNGPHGLMLKGLYLNSCDNSMRSS